MYHHLPPQGSQSHPVENQYNSQMLLPSGLLMAQCQSYCHLPLQIHLSQSNPLYYIGFLQYVPEPCIFHDVVNFMSSEGNTSKLCCCMTTYSSLVNDVHYMLCLCWTLPKKGATSLEPLPTGIDFLPLVCWHPQSCLQVRSYNVPLVLSALYFRFFNGYIFISKNPFIKRFLG